MDVLVRRLTDEKRFAAIVGVPVNIDSHDFGGLDSREVMIMIG